MLKKPLTYLFLFVGLLLHAQKNQPVQQLLQVDVLVVGGSASGVAAGIQSGRMGVKTIIAEPTSWLGGMITAAGVSAFDGNHQLPSGIFGEFREALYKVYGGPTKVATGWVSNTLFEPHVGDSIFKSITKAIPSLNILYGLHFQSVIKKNGEITGAIFLNQANGKNITIKAKQVIDATELGDVMAQSGAEYNIGMEASEITGENVHVVASNDIVQDITYVAILKDYGMGRDCTIAKPSGYDPAEFDGACTDYYFNKSRIKPTVDAQKMLSYGKLPNHKYMINWPGYGNDIYMNIIEKNETARNQELIKAKEQTKRFVYFIQQQLGFKQLGFADDEYPTSDRLPLIPYHRESRRVKGLVRFTINDLATPFNVPNPFYRTGIAVGDYPVDHHHRKNAKAPQHLDFYPVPSFNLPLGILIPQNVKGLIVAEKSISVSNIVNGTTRLQAICLTIGQAAGTLAAIAVKENKQAADVSVRSVQTALLNAKAYIMPYMDIPMANAHFVVAQKIGATGILKGTGIPKNWANQTFFYPDSLVNATKLSEDLLPITGEKIVFNNHFIDINDALSLITKMANKVAKDKINTTWTFTDKETLKKQVAQKWNDWQFGEWDTTKPLTRIQFAKLLDATIHPFETVQVDHNGNFKLTYKTN